ncbi:MAG: cell division protein SepF [Tissierellia bacterium]|nr:cell division protein SepF [Tissierellia bacterium]
MSFLDKMKNLIIAPDEEEEYEREEMDEISEVTEVEKPRRSYTTSKYAEPKVHAIPRTTSSFKIQIQDPLKYDDAPKIIDHLIRNDAVVVNFEHLEPELKRQVFDFINGGIYAVQGKIQKVTKDIFILAPRDVAVEGIKEELMESGLYTW